MPTATGLIEILISYANFHLTFFAQNFSESFHSWYFCQGPQQRAMGFIQKNMENVLRLINSDFHYVKMNEYNHEQSYSRKRIVFSLHQTYLKTLNYKKLWLVP